MRTSFIINPLIKRNDYNLSLWLLGAKVGETVVKMTEPKNFFKKLENMKAFISREDLSWVNKVCFLLLGRTYEQPTPKEIEKPTIQVGVGANNVFDTSNLKVEIKKMSSWPQDNPTRIYVDTVIDGKEFHYYICKTGKQGRFAKKGNECSVPFSALIPFEMKFLGKTSEEEIINWKGVKGFYQKPQN